MSDLNEGERQETKKDDVNSVKRELCLTVEQLQEERKKREHLMVEAGGEGATKREIVNRAQVNFINYLLRWDRQEYSIKEGE